MLGSRYTMDYVPDEGGITFINGTPSALPETQPELDDRLADGDRVALFHKKSMWPFQYRHGVAMTRKPAESTESSPFHDRRES